MHPTLIPFTHMLSSVNDAFNAAMVKGDMSDFTMYYGRGAGRMPTASTVVADIGDIARNLAHGETRYARAVPDYAEGKVRLRAAGDIVSKFYVRFMVADRPGAFAPLRRFSAGTRLSISRPAKGGQRRQRAGAGCGAHACGEDGRCRCCLKEIMESGVIGVDPVKLRMI